MKKQKSHSSHFILASKFGFIEGKNKLPASVKKTEKTVEN